MKIIYNTHLSWQLKRHNDESLIVLYSDNVITLIQGLISSV